MSMTAGWMWEEAAAVWPCAADPLSLLLARRPPALLKLSHTHPDSIKGKNISSLNPAESHKIRFIPVLFL